MSFLMTVILVVQMLSALAMIGQVSTDTVFSYTLSVLPLFILIFPDEVLNAVSLTLQVMPEALLLAAPFTALATWLLIRMRFT